MVGLPARGKTFTARRLRQYLRFFHGAPCEVFNVGNYRREAVGASSTHDFFDPSNEKSSIVRQDCAQKAMDDLKEWMCKDLLNGKTYDGLPSGRVGIFDATNTTSERRVWIKSQLSSLLTSPRHLIFIGK